MTSYQINSDELVAANSSIHGAMERVRAEVAGLMGQLTALEGSWTGQASAAFQGVVANWRATQVQVDDSMSMINQALGHAAQQYADVERANANMFQYA
ncbi:WXG100 family type VII secretion target [Microbacteriaceae bacterium VKM Ac-2855]|nr:WXG100 family type VII secretion target [Microbacteriaceae bacterium VKM Ac-2855]